MAATDVKKYLAQLRGVFDVDAFLKQDIGPETIRRYYTQCAWVYGLLHSPAGALHLALNPDGHYHPRGFYAQPRWVREQISALGAKDVLELASGKGFNGHWLAPRCPGVRLRGIDLTPLHVALANRRRRPNLTFEVVDYQNLAFGDGAFDLVFAIECLCHARDLWETLGEAHRVLKPGGRLVLTDGFRREGFPQLEPALEVAAQLVELSMSVERFWQIDEFLHVARKCGFRVLECRDLSAAIQPNLLRLQRVARAYLRWPGLARWLTRTLPPYLVRHAVTGLLGAETLRSQAQGYYALILEKPEADT